MDTRGRPPQQLRGSQLVPMLLHALQTAASRAQSSGHHAISKPTTSTSNQITRSVTNEELFDTQADPTAPSSPMETTTNIANNTATSFSPLREPEGTGKQPASPGSPSSPRKTKLSFLFGESTSDDDDNANNNNNNKNTGGAKDDSTGKENDTNKASDSSKENGASPAPTKPKQSDAAGMNEEKNDEAEQQTSEADSAPEQEEKEDEARDNSHTVGDLHRSLHESAKHFKKRRPYSDDDLAFILRLLRSIAECTSQPAGCEDVALMGPEVDKMLELLMPVSQVDVRVAMFTCCVVGSLCATPVSRMQVNQQLAVTTVMGVLEAYSHERRVVHLALMMLSNVALCEHGVFTRSGCDFLVRVVFPFYTEAHVVEAWTAALCNITAIHPETVQPFVEAGLVDSMERIVLFLGDDSRVASRGLQCLSNLSIGFTAGQPPTSLVA